jgi:hypothetical protein
MTLPQRLPQRLVIADGGREAAGFRNEPHGIMPVGRRVPFYRAARLRWRLRVPRTGKNIFPYCRCL